VHKYRSWQRKHLRFVLQASECGRKDQSVIIAQKRSTDGIGICSFVFSAASFGAVELLPVHGGKNNRKTARGFTNIRLLSQNLVAE
jgi:hypothetical protein